MKEQHKKLFIAIANPLFVLCGTLLTVATTTRHIDIALRAFEDREGLAALWMLAVALLALAGLTVLAFRFRFLENTLDKLQSHSLLAQVLFVLYAAFCAGLFVGNFYEHAYAHVERLRGSLSWWEYLPYVYGAVGPLPYGPPRWIFSAVMFFPVAAFYLYFCLSLAGMTKNLIKELTKGEKRVLLYGSLVSVLYIIVLYNLSNVYWAPVMKGTAALIGADILFQYDSGLRVLDNDFANPLLYRIGNSATLRHPLFGIFALPLGIACQIFSANALFYAIALQSLQMIALVGAVIMLSRLVPPANGTQKYLFMALLFLSFPVLVGATPMERNILTLVFLIFGIYEWLNGRSATLWVNGAIGANPIYFPAALLYIRSKKTAVKDLLGGGSTFLLLLLAAGWFSILIDYKSEARDGVGLGYLLYQHSWYDSLCYYITFVESCLFAPPAGMMMSREIPRFRMTASAFESVNPLGVIILAAVIYGFARNYKNRFAQVSFAGVVLSFLLMGVGSWAIAQRDTVFYTLFFSWAYISLIYLAIDKTFDNKAKTVVLALLATLLLIVNGRIAVNILRFGMEYYPMARLY
uniref:Uncharacterized protein n=1 Tax=uncultured bacterium contig00017 TaxID=1181508 RepID=A0A806JXV7_9BACT|nr:hypothetical protein [uncultured bacterium contig00017]